MPPLNLYIVFYLNQMYSAISIKDRIKVIKQCYWPVMDLIEKGVPIGVQVSGVTLEIVNELEPEWIKRLKKHLLDKRCELVGNGYSQIIAPLVPAKVNYYNQMLGLETYKNILNATPKIATINEMAYSSGVIEHFLDNGYQAIMMEWNNPRRYHPEWHDLWRHYRQNAVGADDRYIPLIWVDTIAFQKFQRYAHGELSLNDYIQYLLDYSRKSSNGYMCAYASDSEVFDFRPNRFHTEAKIDDDGEWNKIDTLFNHLMKNNEFNLLLPSQIIDLPSTRFSDKQLRLECPQQPIPVKKQEKYNIYRWALTGRNDLEINTKCYRIYKFLEENGNEKTEDWKELCYLWSSDFRTHITEDRWGIYQDRLNRFLKSNEKKNSSQATKDEQIIKLPYENTLFQCFEDKRYLTIENNLIKCIFNKSKGLAIHSFWFKNKSKEPLFGTLPHGYYDDISFGADFYTGHMIIEKLGEHKITDLIPCTPVITFNDKDSLIIRDELNRNDTTFEKEYQINLKEPSLEIKCKIHMPVRELSIIHVGNITFIPTSFDKTALFFATHNGGYEMEKFKIGDSIINHAQSLSALISAKHGLGATEGIVVVGDNEKKINIYHDQTISALIPSVHYNPLDNNLYFLRLQYSAQEIDETFKPSDKDQKLNFYWKIT